MYTARSAMAIQSDFSQACSLLEQRLTDLADKEILETKEDMVRQNWEDLRQVGRG